MRVVEIDQRICTGCRECSGVCPVGAITGEHRQPQHIDTEKCVMCGQCVQKCKSYVSLVSHESGMYEKIRAERGLPETVTEPLFAAHFVSHVKEVEQALDDPKVFTVVQCAPAVRVGIAEDFGFSYGKLTAGKLAASLRRLGFDRVYDTCFGADLTVMEEAAELVNRIKSGENLPMFTSCCPAWVTWIERNYPNKTNLLSTCKSPMEMFGAVAKTYGAKVNKVKAEKIFSVAVMPCTCKEFEASRSEMDASGYRDVDAVITTRELVYLIKEKGIDFVKLKDEEFDQPLGEYSGAGEIFGATGGVAEAAVRTAYEMITGEPIRRVDIYDIRGGEGFRISVIKIGDLEFKVGIVAGLKNVIPVMESIEKGELDLHFIEVMTCPEGCISGGGMPKILLDIDYRYAYDNRKAALYGNDKNMKIRKSSDNPSIVRLYDDYLKSPGSNTAHKLLHTKYCSGQASAIERN